MRPLPAWIKNTALALIILGFAGAMCYLALQRDYDRFLALAGILVAIVSSPIFSVRADMEKHLFTLQTEKRYEVYRQLAAHLQTWLGNLYTLAADPRLKEHPKYRANFENGFDTFSMFCAQYSLFFSDGVNELLHDICMASARIDLPVKLQYPQDEKFVSDVTKIQKMHQEIKNLMRKEIGL